MLTKKVYIPIGVSLVLLLAIGFFALRSDVPDEPVKAYKATQSTEKSETPAAKTESIGQIETTAGGHKHADGSWHAEPHSEQKTGVNPPQPDKSDKQLTELEKSLLDSGVDIFQLPRDSDGNLIRGPTGGIALVKNPVAPTQADVERFEKKRRLTERLAEITTELQSFPPAPKLSTEDALRVTDLLAEQLKVSQELGFKIQSKSGDLLVALELQRFKLELMAKNPERYPVSAAPRLIELNRKLHRHDMADAINKAYQKAIDNGESSFMLNPEDN